MGHLLLPHGSSKRPQSAKRPRQESNLVYELRGLACESGTLQGHVVSQYLARESNPVLRFRRPPCRPSHSQGIADRVARPGVEPGPTASEADMLSGTPTGHVQYPGLESNQDQNLRRVLCCPLHHRDVRADDWIRTSMVPLTRRTPFSVEPRRLQGYPKGVEPLPPASQAGVPTAYTTDTILLQRKGRESNPQGREAQPGPVAGTDAQRWSG